MTEQTTNSRVKQLVDWIRADSWRVQCLLALRRSGLKDHWIGAGFVRNLVWDHLHGISDVEASEDIDVVFYDPRDTSREREKAAQSQLSAIFNAPWSVKNQSRMHLRAGLPPFQSLEDALANWLETATSICVRIDENWDFQVNAVYGLDDLFNQLLRPTPFGAEHIDVLRSRAQKKGWLRRWPNLQFLSEHASGVEEPGASPTPERVYLEHILRCDPEDWTRRI